MSSTIRLALDWTPNTLHTGFYVAQAMGGYARNGLTIEFILPDQDDYQLTPAKRVIQGQADLAIAPSESVVSYQIDGIPLVAISAVLARDPSAIVTLKDRRIDRPQQLDGKVYASYGGRFEEEIIRRVVINDGGRGQLLIRKPARFNIWPALLTREADAAWIFLPWEGVEADMRGIQLTSFLFSEYEVPYGYSSLLIAHHDYITTQSDAMRRFLAATAEGYHFAAHHPEEAAWLLMDTAQHPTLTNADFIEQSQHIITDYYLDQSGKWGPMRREVWNAFVHWLIRNDFLIDKDGEKVRSIAIDSLFTNEFWS